MIILRWKGQPKTDKNTSITHISHGHWHPITSATHHHLQWNSSNSSQFQIFGLTLDNKLSFDWHTTDIQKRSQQRLSAVRKLKGLHVAPPSPPSVMSECCPTHSALLLHLFPKHAHCRKPGQTHSHSRHCCQDHRSPYSQPLRTEPQGHHMHCKCNSTGHHPPTHPLTCHLTVLPSGRRYRTLKCRSAWFSHSRPKQSEALGHHYLIHCTTCHV